MTDRRAEIATTIRRRIMSGLHLGTLAGGERLPSTRQVAEEFGATPRTAMAAYRALEREGLVELRARSGIYVAPVHHTGGIVASHLAGWVIDMLVDGRAREVPPIELPEHVRRCLETLRLRALCVAGNADQLDHLCRELRDDYGLVPEGLEADTLGAPDDGVRRALARADLLVSTSLHGPLVQRVAARLGKPAVTVTLRADVMGEITRHLAKGPVYFVASDARFAEALDTVFAPTGHGMNVRLVVVGRDDPAAIPDDAPTYIMPRAYERLADTPLTARVKPRMRVFSDETARELLTFIVRANIAAMAASRQ